MSHYDCRDCGDSYGISAEYCSNCATTPAQGLDAATIERLRELVEKASPLPWVYRPDKFDDWGWIRGVEKDSDIGRYRPIVANAKNSDVGFDQMDDYRRAGTDPYGPNAELIVAAVNLIPALLNTASTTTHAEDAIEQAAINLHCHARRVTQSREEAEAAWHIVDEAWRENCRGFARAALQGDAAHTSQEKGE